MNEQTLESLRFPTGRFKAPEKFSIEQLEDGIGVIENFPSLLIPLVESLTEEQLRKTYRPGGWNVRQLVHHLADSHMNSFIRYKLAMTEEVPTIKTYMEDKWSEMIDNRQLEIEPSLKILSGLHQRWAYILRNMKTDDFKRAFFHPEFKSEMSLYVATALYTWHCRHHLQHIRIALGIA